jgi:release factor glutamine methyltransferase
MPMTQPPQSLEAVAATLRASGCVFAEDEARLLIAAAPDPGTLAAMVERRAAGLPIEHVVGWAEFCGLRVPVDRGVFVPRRRTELLVRQAVALLGGARTSQESPRPAGAGPARPVVVDLCCGSGAIGAAIAAAAGPVELHAADIDAAAVRCARRAVGPYGGRVHLGDLYQALPVTLRGRVGLLAANVPYVPTEQIRLLPAEARLHESAAALDGGSDGLAVLRRVAGAAPRWLAPGGYLLSEASEQQADRAAAAMRAAGLSPTVERSDDLGVAVIIGRYA